MSSITFTIPGEPRAKGRPRMTESGHVYTPKNTTTYENLVKITYMNEVRKVMPFGQDAQIRIDILAQMAIPKSASKKAKALMLAGIEKPAKKPDFDNVGKVICDALNGLAYRDDSAITTATVRKRWASVPCVVVTICEDREDA